MSWWAEWADEQEFNTLKELVRDIEGAAEILEEAEVEAINAVAGRALKSAKRAIFSKVNLTKGYIDDRMDLVKAGKVNREAMIISRYRPTRLATYGAKQVTVAAKRAKGDKLRGIPAGRKQAGVMTGVKRGSTSKRLPFAFLIPLRAQRRAGGNGLGIFTRQGDEITHRYGPSVSTVFDWSIPEIAGEIADDLKRTVADQKEQKIRKALKL